MTRFAKYLVWKGLFATEADVAALGIVKVFAAFMEGELRPTNATGETELLDSMDKAYDAAPELMTLLFSAFRRPPRELEPA